MSIPYGSTGKNDSTATCAYCGNTHSGRGGNCYGCGAGQSTGALFTVDGDDIVLGQAIMRALKEDKLPAQQPDYLRG